MINISKSSPYEQIIRILLKELPNYTATVEEQSLLLNFVEEDLNNDYNYLELILGNTGIKNLLHNKKLEVIIKKYQDEIKFFLKHSNSNVTPQKKIEFFEKDLTSSVLEYYEDNSLEELSLDSEPIDEEPANRSETSTEKINLSGSSTDDVANNDSPNDIFIE
jgi:hypothetical protein